MIETYLTYSVFILFGSAMIMPLAYDLIEEYKQNQTAKRLHREHETRVYCSECSNYKHQNKMFTLDICLDCHDLQVTERWEALNG